MKYVVDTNVLLEYPEIFNTNLNDTIIIHTIVASELDNQIHNKYGNNELAYKARQARNAIKLADNKEYSNYRPVELDAGLSFEVNDDVILGFCKDNGYVICTNDLAMQIKADTIGVKWIEYNGNNCEGSYKGFQVVEMNTTEMAEWYQIDKKENLWNLYENEYLLIKSKSDDKIVDTWIWTESGFRHLQTSKIDSASIGKIKLLDDYQYCAIDSFINNPITMIKGKPGTGKSLLTVAYAMYAIENNKSKFDKLIVFTNPLATRGSAKLGYYPGSKDEKLLDSQIGHMLGSKFGNKQGVERLIQDNKLMLLPFSDIRGFDTTDMRAIIWITEAQNLDIELMRLAIQRIGNDCKLIIDGDYEAQIDCSSFEGSKNGMRRVSEVFRGQEFYGEVELQNVYRSKWADWANKL